MPFKPARNHDAEANAETLQREVGQCSRGVVASGSGVCVVFGNDGFNQDERVPLEVTLLRQHIQETGLPELGFGKSGDGRTWALMFVSVRAEAVMEALIDAWRIAFDVEADRAADEMLFIDRLSFPDCTTQLPGRDLSIRGGVRIGRPFPEAPALVKTLRTALVGMTPE